MRPFKACTLYNLSGHRIYLLIDGALSLRLYSYDAVCWRIVSDLTNHSQWERDLANYDSLEHLYRTNWLQGYSLEPFHLQNPHDLMLHPIPAQKHHLCQLIS